MTTGQFLKRLLIVPPILAGIALIVVQVRMRAEPEKVEAAEDVRIVRVIEAKAVPVVPRVLAYGRVRPARVWAAVAQVAGEIVEMHPRLRNGSVILEGEPLLRIDPTDYELALRRIRADISAATADLANLEARATNLEASLEIERRALVLAESDLERKRQLRERGAAAEALVDQAETTVLTNRSRVQNLVNDLALIPSQRDVIRAQLAQLEAQAEIAQLDLDRTRITAPFDLRIAELAVEESEAVSKGQQLFEGQDIQTAEVEAQAPLPQMRELARGLPTMNTDLMTQPERIPFVAEVRLSVGDINARWAARIDRISEAIDPTARTIGIVVAVDESYGKAIPGERPPLFPNMYVQVVISGAPRPDEVVIPRAAYRGGRVYVVGEDDRLDIRSVTGGLIQASFAGIKDGVQPGERVVVSDLIPAIEGMKLMPVLDQALADRIVAEAIGSGDVR